jgi:hypothetical protein
VEAHKNYLEVCSLKEYFSVETGSYIVFVKNDNLWQIFLVKKDVHVLILIIDNFSTKFIKQAYYIDQNFYFDSDKTLLKMDFLLFLLEKSFQKWDYIVA